MYEARPRHHAEAIPPVPVSIGVFAHNEEATIGAVLDALLSQQMSTVVIAQIIVVSCGSTDATGYSIIPARKDSTNTTARIGLFCFG